MELARRRKIAELEEVGRGEEKCTNQVNRALFPVTPTTNNITTFISLALLALLDTWAKSELGNEQT